MHSVTDRQTNSLMLIGDPTVSVQSAEKHNGNSIVQSSKRTHIRSRDCSVDLVV